MPHGDAGEWAFEQFKNQAKAAGGEISDDLLQEFKDQLSHALSLSDDNIEMMYQEEDYI